VKLSVVLRQYSTSNTQYRAAQSLKIWESLPHCLNYSSSYSTYRTGTGVLQRPQQYYRRPICLGNSVAVLDLQRQSRQQYQAPGGPFNRVFDSEMTKRIVSATASELLVLLQRPYCLGNSISSTFYSVRSIQAYRSYQYLSKQGQYPIEPTTVLVQSQDSTPFK
jgi:hypothetical protein